MVCPGASFDMNRTHPADAKNSDIEVHLRAALTTASFDPLVE
jgi:hypothetical protein